MPILDLGTNQPYKSNFKYIFTYYLINMMFATLFNLVTVFTLHVF